MKRNKILLGFGMLVLGLATFTGCGNKEQAEEEVKFEPVQISSVLAGEANKDVSVEGVVYLSLSDGYYISDGSEQIFVKDSTNTPKVGDKVQVTAGYKYVKQQPYINVVRASYYKVAAANQTVYTTATNKDISVINSLNAASKTGVYGQIVNIGKANLVKEGTVYRLENYADEDQKVYITNGSNKTTLSSFVGRRVNLQAVISNYDSTTQSWYVACNATPTASDYTAVELAGVIEPKLDQAVPTSILGTMPTLPLSFEAYDNTTITWSVENVDPMDTNEYATVDNETGIVSVNYSDQTKRFNLVANYGAAHGETHTTPCTYSIEVTSNGIVEKSIKDILTLKANTNHIYNTINNSYIKTYGVVVGKTRNQSGSLFGLILKDYENTDATYVVQVDVLAEKYNSIKVGNVIHIEGTYRTADNDRTTILNYVEGTTKTQIGTITVDNEDQQVSYATPDFVVDSQEDLTTLAENWNTTYVGKLVKFVAPKAIWSVSEASKITSKSYLSLTYAEDGSLGFKLNGKDGLATQICLVVERNSENMNNNTVWANQDIFNFHYSDGNSVATTWDVTFYAIPSFYSENTIAMLFIQNEDCFVCNDEAVQFEYITNSATGSSTDLTSASPYQIELPQTYVGKDITWTCEDTDHVTIAEDDNVLYATFSPETTTDVNVTIKASYTAEGATDPTEVSIAYTIQKDAPKTISEAAAAETGVSGMIVEGYVIGIVPAGSGFNISNGIFVSDGKKVLKIADCAGMTMPAKDMEKVYINDTLVTVGMYVKFTGVKILEKGYNFKATKVELDATKNITIDHSFVQYADEDVVVIDSNEDIAAYTSTESYKVTNKELDIVKVVGTTEKPFYIGAASGSYATGIYYADEASDITNKDKVFRVENTKKAGFLVKAVNSQNAWGEDWVLINTPTYQFDNEYQYGSRATTTSETAPAYKFVGTMYFIKNYVGSSDSPYTYFSTVLGRFDVQEDLDRVKEFVTSGFATSVDSNATYEYTITPNSLITELTITSDNETLLKPTTTVDETTHKGSVTSGEASDDTNVTLTFSFKYNGQPMTATKVVKVKKAVTKIYKKVTDVSTLAVGDKIIMFRKGYGYVAKTDGLGQAITISNDQILSNTLSTDVQVYELVAGSETGYFGIKCVNGANAGQVIVSSSSSSSNNIALKYQNTATAKASWSFTYSSTDDGMIVTTKDTTNSNRYLNNYISGNDYKFSLCKTATSTVGIYKLFVEND